MRVTKTSPIKQIRKYCLSCCGGSRREVRNCPCLDCELWSLRLGKRQRLVLRQDEQAFKQSTERENFEKGDTYET